MSHAERVHRALAGRSRVRTLEALRAHVEPMSVDELAERMDLHPNTLRFHLQQLVDAGLVTQQKQPRAQRGRPRMVYSAMPSHPAAADTDIYRGMAEALAIHLEASTSDPAAAATAAGRTWGRDLARRAQATAGDGSASRDTLMTLLDEFGFEPHTSSASTTDPGADIELHRCPLLDVARAHAPVTCGLHLGMMQGVLLETGDHVQATELHPFSSPGICVARLSDRTTGAVA